MSDTKIAWHKYEDVLRRQITSPLIPLFLENGHVDELLDPSENEAEEMEYPEMEELIGTEMLVVPVPDSFYNQISLITNYDCWMAYTAFNITPRIKKKLNKIEGVEVLKICGRYRFFVGVGKLFKFSDVRRSIESEIV